MEENLQQNKLLVFMKRIWPATLRIITLIFYTIFTFIKNVIGYIVDQIKNY